MIKLQAVLKRRWPVLLLAIAIGAASGVVTARLAPKDVVQMWVAEQVVAANSKASNVTSVSQDSLRVTRGKVPERAAARLGTPDQADELAARINVSVDQDANTFSVSTEDVSPDVASKRVDAFVVEFIAVTNGAIQKDDQVQIDLLQSEVDQAKKELDKFDAANPTIASLNVSGTFAEQALIEERRGLVDLLNQAQLELRRYQLQVSDTQPYESLGYERPHLASAGLLKIPGSPIARAFFLGLIGALVGVVVIAIIERVQRRIDTRDELASIVDLPVLAEIGIIPSNRRSGADEGRVFLEGIWAEPYRRVRSAVQFMQIAEAARTEAADAPAVKRELPPLSILITSTSPGEGKSTSAALTGYALAELGTPTLVVGADFRRPEVDRMLGVTGGPNIRELAESAPGAMAVVDVVHETECRDLYVAPAGPPTREVSGVIGATKRVVREALSRGVMAVIDSSPLQVANDTLDLLPIVDYTIIVVRSGSSSADDLLDTIETLRRLNAKILGVIIVGTPSVGKKQASYYDYYAAADFLPDMAKPEEADSTTSERDSDGSDAGGDDAANAPRGSFADGDSAPAEV